MNKRRLCASVAILVLALLGGGASFAELGTVDVVPGSTLLLPYFEVDLDNANGVNTLFSVNNASAAPTVAHVTVWSNATVPVLDFNVYLTGYDVQTMSMRDILNGVLPHTADLDSDDAADSISPGGVGPIPAPLAWNPPLWEDSFFGCGGAPFIVPQILIDRMQDGLTGKPTTFDVGQCVGIDQGDNVARGYVTVDDVSECSVLFPGEVGYFGSGIPTTDNQLWGDFFIVDSPNDFAMGETLVHVESDPNVQFGQTFYGRHVSFLGTDQREALGNQFGVRYLSGGEFDGGTDLIVWREGATWNNGRNDLTAFTCGTGPSWWPMNESLVVAFNESEDWHLLCQPDIEIPVISPPIPGGDDPTCFPLEAQRVSVGTAPLNPNYNFGWLFLDLQAQAVATPESPATVENQAWVIANMSALNRFTVGFDAVQLNNVTGNSDNIVTAGSQ